MAAKKTIKRIKLSDGKAIVEEDNKPAQGSAPANPAPEPPKKRFKRPAGKSLLRPASGTFGYLKGSWQELRQVRWPNRRATWVLTLAVIIFTLFFVLVILVLDAAFQFLFKEVLLK